MRFKLYSIAALCSVGAGLLNALAIRYSLYWTFSWFDVVVHVLASIMVFIVSFALFSHRFETKKALYLALGSTLVVGVLWEIFEYISGATRFEPGLIEDTLYDLASDIFGGAIGAWVSFTEANKIEKR